MMVLRKIYNLDEVEEEIRSGSIVYTEKSDRGIGKSRLLHMLSKELRKPVVVHSKIRAQRLMSENKELIVMDAPHLETYLMGKDTLFVKDIFKKGVLVDEGGEIEQEVITKKLKELKIPYAGFQVLY